MENHKPPVECEPSGLDALASAAVLEENVDPESSVGATTKHPRHRPGCTCIVCIQPPSGKGKHKPTCTCNVCMTVKRRFKTLMLRKKKLQSERESEISKNGSNDLKDEPETNRTSENAIMNTNHQENDRIQTGKQIEVADTSTGQIDLNSHPNREDMQVDVLGLRLLNHVDAANHPLDDYVKQNAFSNLVRHEQGSMTALFSQTNDDTLRPLSDDALLASLGWGRDAKGN